MGFMVRNSLGGRERKSSVLSWQEEEEEEEKTTKDTDESLKSRSEKALYTAWVGVASLFSEVSYIFFSMGVLGEMAEKKVLKSASFLLMYYSKVAKFAEVWVFCAHFGRSF
jgi:hypothetical protein